MGTIYPSPVRNIGSRVGVTWTDSIPVSYATDPAIVSVVGSNPYVSIDQVSFATMNFSFGGVIQLQFGSSINPTVSVTIPPGQSNASALASLINSAVSIAMPGYPNVAVDVGFLKLFDANYIKILDNGTTGSITINEIGFPGTPSFPYVKDISNVSSTSKMTDFSIYDDRSDILSNQVSIPEGSNSLSIWINTIAVAQYSSQAYSPDIFVTFTNGIDGNPTDKFTFGHSFLQDLGPQTILDGQSYRSELSLLIKLKNGFVSQLNPWPPGVVTAHSPIILMVPPGATGMSIGATPSRDFFNLNNNINFPTLPPIVSSVGVNFAAR